MIHFQFGGESNRVYRMYRPLLATLLLGLFPATQDINTDGMTLENMEIAPPSTELHFEDRLSASGVVIFNRDSGQILYTREHKIQRSMASLTKLMTALIIVENHELDELVTIPQSVVDSVGNKAYLPPGKKFTVGDLLSALLVNSANDSALTLAQFHSGSTPAFVAEMNERALELGLRSTSFRNPSGLDHPAHWSTPQDIAWLSMFAMRYPEIATRLGRSGQRIVSTDGDTIHLYHTHALLHKPSDTTAEVLAGKTGTTVDAGQCLMSIVEANDTQYVVVLLHSAERYTDMKTILEAMSKSVAPVAIKHNIEL